MSVAPQLDRLEHSILELRVEFERFFNGDRPTPPEGVRTRIQTVFRRLRSGNQIRDPADHYRLSQLEARFNSYSELYNRRVREREEGDRRARFTATPAFDPAAGVVVEEWGFEPGAAEALYRGLAAGHGAPGFDLETFRGYLDRQLETIRTKTGCSRVQFRLAAEGGKTKLKAKPLPGSGTAPESRGDIQ
jgi:hypothetical protein